jgi:hypothetical protein
MGNDNEHTATYEDEIGVLTAVVAKGNAAIEEEIEKTYQPMKTVADRTTAGYTSGLKSMDVFCDLQKVKKMSEYKTADFDDPQVCEQIIFNLKCFCSFMLTAQSNRGKNYMPGSQSQMLSNVFNYLHKAHPAVKMFDQDKYPVESKWYTESLHGLKRNGFVNAIKRGESVGDKTIGIRRRLLHAVIRKLIQEERYKEASAVCTLYHAVGRGGEVADTTFTSMKWDSTLEALWAGWPEVKTTHYTDLSFFANVHSYGYPTCYMWTFGAYIIMEEGALRTQKNMPDFIYPDYRKLKGSASAKVTQAISSLVGKVDGLLKEHTSHGLRVGATDDMLSNNFCHLACAIARGAWDYSGVCMIFSYFTKNLHVSTSGKALAGVSDCRQHHSMPTLDALPQGAYDKINHMAELLFMWGPDAFKKPHGHLVLARDALLAVQLMWIQQIAQDFGNENGLFKKLVEKATIAQITLDELYEYSNLIRHRYEADLIRNQQNSGHCIQSLRESVKNLTKMLNHQMSQLRLVVRTLKDEVQSLNNKLDTQQHQLDTVQEKQVMLLEQNATLTSTVNDMRDELFKMSNNLIRYMTGGQVVTNDEMSPATTSTTSTKRPRVSLGGGGNDAVILDSGGGNDTVIDLCDDHSEKTQPPAAKKLKANIVNGVGKVNKPKARLSQTSLVFPRRPSQLKQPSPPLPAAPPPPLPAAPPPPLPAAPPPPLLAARSPPLLAKANTSSLVGFEWKDSMKLRLANFLINCSMNDFPAFAARPVQRDCSKQVKGKLKMVYNCALKFADAEQKQILNTPRVPESDRLRYAGYFATLTLACDELASQVYNHVVTNNLLVQLVPKNKSKAPTEYKNLVVSYTYNKLEQIRKQKKKTQADQEGEDQEGEDQDGEDQEGEDQEGEE